MMRHRAELSEWRRRHPLPEETVDAFELLVPEIRAEEDRGDQRRRERFDRRAERNRPRDDGVIWNHLVAFQKRPPADDGTAVAETNRNPRSSSQAEKYPRYPQLWERWQMADGDHRDDSDESSGESFEKDCKGKRRRRSRSRSWSRDRDGRRYARSRSSSSHVDGVVATADPTVAPAASEASKEKRQRLLLEAMAFHPATRMRSKAAECLRTDQGPVDDHSGRNRYKTGRKGKGKGGDRSRRHRNMQHERGRGNSRNTAAAPSASASASTSALPDLRMLLNRKKPPN